jgi:hypothetical protein
LDISDNLLPLRGALGQLTEGNNRKMESMLASKQGSGFEADSNSGKNTEHFYVAV